MNLIDLIRMAGLQGGPPPPMRMPPSISGVGSRMDEVGSVIGGLPVEGVNAPEIPKVTAPTNATASASVAVPAADVPVHGKKGGLGSFLESIFMPDADSRWAAALRGGLYDAKANQRKYVQGEELNQATLDEAHAKALAAQNKAAHGDTSIAGNNIVRHLPNGEVEFITPPPQPTEMERLIDKWHDPATDAETKKLIERAIRGYQYTPEVINAREDARLRTGTALAAARGEQARRTKQTPGATAVGGARRTKIKPPAGYVLE